MTAQTSQNVLCPAAVYNACMKARKDEKGERESERVTQREIETVRQRKTDRKRQRLGRGGGVGGS